MGLETLDRHLLALEPQYRERVWGGQRLRSANPPVGEAWIAWGGSRVLDGALAGQTLESLAAAHGAALLGTTVAARFGPRFPLLAKLLDCADWLSVQVHPNDEQAIRMVGPGEFGKTEAWYFLRAEAGSRILVGVKPRVAPQELADAIRSGRILEVAEPIDIRGGEALLIPAGTLHALGPGLLLYEIQQASDTTYRVYDWDRPSSAARALHIEESVAVTSAVGPGEVRYPRVESGTGTAPVIRSAYFDLRLLQASPESGAVNADTGARTFHILTVIEGRAEIRRMDERMILGQFDTALVAGSAGAYEVRALDGQATLLRAAVPDGEPDPGRV